LATATVLTGGAALAKWGLVGTATAGVKGLTYAAIAVNTGRVIYSGGADGKLDLAMDATGLAFLRYARAAVGLQKLGWYATDTAINAYQGYTGITGAYDSFRNESYIGGSLQLISGLLGATSAVYEARGLGRMMAADPTMNPLNYRLSSKSMATWSGFGDLPLRYVPPQGELGEIAFELWRHQGTGSGGQLTRFAKRLGAKTYSDIYGAGVFPTEELLEKMMHGASRLHVNLDGLLKNVDELPDIIRMGSKDMNYRTPTGSGNITN